MNLILETHDFKHIYDLSKYDIDDIIYGSDEVKEIAIAANRTDNIPKLEKLYQLLKDIEPYNIKKITLQYTDFQINYTFKVKGLYYRTFLYEKERKEMAREILSIRFVEDNYIIPNLIENKIYCNLKCPYYKIDLCKKYKKKLHIKEDKALICRNCFLEMWPTIGEEIYNNMLEVKDE